MRLSVFDEARELWGLPRRHEFSGAFGSVGFEAPQGWNVELADGVIEILPEDDEGAMHISIRGRDTSRPVERGAGEQILARFASVMTSEPVQTHERIAPWGLVARSTFEVREPTSSRHIELFMAVASSSIIASTWIDDGSSEETRAKARAIVDSMSVSATGI